MTETKFIEIDGNIIRVDSIVAITDFRAYPLPSGIWHTFNIILKNGEKIEISDKDKESVIRKREKLIEDIKVIYNEP